MVNSHGFEVHNVLMTILTSTRWCSCSFSCSGCCSSGGSSSCCACSIEAALASHLKDWPEQEVSGDGAVAARGVVDT